MSDLQQGTIPCRHCEGKGTVHCECDDGNLMIVVGHPLNTEDFRSYGSSQGYVVKQCRLCSRVWAIRWQYDAGTGSDDRAKDCGFGDPFKLVTERHY